MLLQSKNQLVGRFNVHLERLLFAQVGEAFWAGDKEAEGALKSFADAKVMTYEEKFVGLRSGMNYTRLMFTSNETWVVPAWSGGRRWFVLDVGDAHEKDHASFAAIDEEMESGGTRGIPTGTTDTRNHQQSKERSNHGRADQQISRWMRGKCGCATC